MLVSPKQLQQSVHAGVARLHNLRKARKMFVESYVGPYYNKSRGKIGDHPINQIFAGIRVLLPNLVFENPSHEVLTEYTQYREYAELLGLALKFMDKQQNISEVYEDWIMDTLFSGVGILKTGLATSSSVITMPDGSEVDPGEIYTAHVDFDRFIIDPTIQTSMREAGWAGDIITVPRSELLESGLYDNTLIERLPKADYLKSRQTKDISIPSDQHDKLAFMDEVEIAEIWVPGDNTVKTVPVSKDMMFDKFIREDDYYGPQAGPYTYMSFTPRPPGNPFPIQMIGIWHDLHVLGNKAAKKLIEKTQRQKDIIGYSGDAADDAQAIVESSDGQSVLMDNPDGVRVHSFGGADQNAIFSTQWMQQQFNSMAANPQAVGGQTLGADSATEARILAQNSDIGLSALQKSLYKAAAEEAGKRAWYLHTDPLLQMPLTRRETVDGPDGPKVEDVQVELSPEVRRGDFLDFHFTIVPESMVRETKAFRFQQTQIFALQILPAAFQAGQMAAGLGLPFNIQAYLQKMAKEAGITWYDEVLDDPLFRQKQEMLLATSPQFAKGVAGQPKGDGGLAQNGQPGVTQKVTSPEEMLKQIQQLGANVPQQNRTAPGGIT